MLLYHFIIISYSFCRPLYSLILSHSLLSHLFNLTLSLHLISTTLEIVSTPEKRQMQMVSAAFNHLCDKLKGGEVTADVVQKLSQLVSDLANRNFVNASAIQTVSVLHRFIHESTSY